MSFQNTASRLKRHEASDTTSRKPQFESPTSLTPLKFIRLFVSFVLLTQLISFSRPPHSPFDGTWESLQKMPVPAWFEDGKIGIFIHWGPYSVLGYQKKGRGYAEHTPKTIYSDPKHHYPVLKERFGAAPPRIRLQGSDKPFQS